MSTNPDSSFRYFDRHDDVLVTERSLPHWAQNGTVCFMTWRTWDSMPAHVLRSWLTARNEWLRKEGVAPDAPDWKERFERLPLAKQRVFHDKISARWEACLDEGHGACVLRRPDCAKLVADSLHHFDDDRYQLLDFVVMPNHVHLLAAFKSAELMLQQCTSWKHYTAVAIIKILQRRGRFWEIDGFDHLVRSPDQGEYFREYIGSNPGRAKLRAGEFVHYSRQMTFKT